MVTKTALLQCITRKGSAYLYNRDIHLERRGLSSSIIFSASSDMIRLAIFAYLNDSILATLNGSKRFGPEKGHTVPGFSVTEKTGVPCIFDIELRLPEETACQSYRCCLSAVALEPYLIQPDDG
jgi:hypothetical protein